MNAPDKTQKNKAGEAVHTLLKLLSVVLLATALLLSSPAGFLATAQAAPIEDCDLDGYDDVTGDPVPWAGFDSTRGDVIPDDWDGVSCSYEKPAGAGYSGPAKGSSNTGSTGGKTTKTSSSSADGAAAGVTTGGGAAAGGASAAGSAGTAAGAAVGTDGTVNGDAVTENAGTPDGSTPVATSGSDTTLTEATPAEPQTDLTVILAARGTLQIADAQDAALHAGGQIVITGDGFAANVPGLSVQIHSATPRTLGTTATDSAGHFEQQAQLPQNLAPGTHHIVVRYQGRELARQTIKVGPVAAATLWQALTVGFTADNRAELLAGSIVLLVLLIAGALALITNPLRHPTPTRV